MADKTKPYDARLAKQREYQREYRKRMKASKTPDRNAIAHAFLHYTVSEALDKDSTKQKLMLILDKVADLLIEQGYDKRATDTAVDSLLDRYESGWEFRRKVHLLSRTDTDDTTAADADEG